MTTIRARNKRRHASHLHQAKTALARREIDRVLKQAMAVAQLSDVMRVPGFAQAAFSSVFELQAMLRK